jgi:DNA-binding HxlR family transcriptional regulator
MNYKIEEKKKPYPETSPEAVALNLVGDKWTLLIMKTIIEKGPIRFRDLREHLTVSNEQLRTNCNRLVASGLLTRTRYKEVPPRVDYEATAKGKALKPVLKALAKWAEQS